MMKLRRFYVSLIFLGCFWLLFVAEHWSPDPILYSRPYALASYLSLTGAEGVVSSGLYVMCAQRLALSWARHVPVESRMQYDMILIITDPYKLLTASAARTLREVGWNLVKMEPLYGKPDQPSYLAQNRYTHTAQFTKLRLWTLEGYNHIVYLDADMLITKDLVYEMRGYNANINALGVARSRDGPMINGGMLLIKPSKRVFGSMVDSIMSSEYNVFFQEQGFLDVFWRSEPYSVMWMPSELNEFVNNLTDATVVIHFLSSWKPWAICPDPVVYTWPCDEWHSYD
jgi:hypothetical protein